MRERSGSAHLIFGPGENWQSKMRAVEVISDWDATHILISDRLPGEEPELVVSLRSKLPSAGFETIIGTNDIWCRDYMPVQVGTNAFVQFSYRPDYLRGYEYLITRPDSCRLPFMQEYRAESIVLDGGNVVASQAKVILTDKIYSENPSIAKAMLRSRLAELFQADCIVIPREPIDPIGHADGMVRFIAEGRVLMNDYSALAPKFGDTLRSLLERKGLVVETLPMFQEANGRLDAIPSAVGLYINYLRVGRVIILPAYDCPEDQAALLKMQQVLPEATIGQVLSRSLAEKGGVLNCVSWTIKRDVDPEGGI